MAEYYVGLDVHSRESVFVITQNDGTVVARGAVPTDPAGLAQMREAHRLPAGTPVALETGTTSFYVARELARLELAPIVIDAHEVRLKAHRPQQKSDRRDALELCEGMRRGYYRAVVYVPSPEISALRTTLSRRRHFVRIQTAEVNAVKRLLRTIGRQYGTRGSLRTESGWERLLGSALLPAELVGHARHHYALWRQAATEVRALDHELGEQARIRKTEVQRLETVPGVGPIVALTAIAVFADVQRFTSAKHAASYSGLVPRTYQSGDRDGHGHITRRGSAELRAMLCEAAHQAHRPSHPLHPHYAKIRTRRGVKTAVVAIAHRLCRILFAMLRDERDFQPALAGVEEGTFTRTTTRKYRLTPKPSGRRVAIS